MTFSPGDRVQFIVSDHPLDRWLAMIVRHNLRGTVVSTPEDCPKTSVWVRWDHRYGNKGINPENPKDLQKIDSLLEQIAEAADAW